MGQSHGPASGSEPGIRRDHYRLATRKARGTPDELGTSLLHRAARLLFGQVLIRELLHESIRKEDCDWLGTGPI